MGGGGLTQSADFPHTVGPAHAGGSDTFFARLAPSGAVLWSRLASRVLWPIAEFPCADEHALYAGVTAIDWTRPHGRALDGAPPR